MMLLLLRVKITINMPGEIIEVILFYKEFISLGSSLALFMREATIGLRLSEICPRLLIDRRVGRAQLRYSSNGKCENVEPSQ